MYLSEGIDVTRPAERVEFMTEALYTEAEIKAAFWAEFHCSGELWFPERPPDNATRATTVHWESFLTHLRQVEDPPRGSSS